jgi:hypothetical protein
LVDHHFQPALLNVIPNPPVARPSGRVTDGVKDLLFISCLGVVREDSNTSSRLAFALAIPKTMAALGAAIFDFIHLRTLPYLTGDT